MTREMGKVLAEARGDVQEGIDIAYLMAGEGRRMAGETVPSELPDKWAMSIRQPLGVAGIITPWNFPMAIPCWKTMPALVTGNTVVFKPSSDTPHCATLLVELMAEAGFPPGVVNLVTGSGGEVGDAIVDSPDVAVISFTGSSTTGKRIAERAAGASSASRSSSVARTASSCSPTPTSTSPPTGSCGRPSGRPASAARPRRGSSSSGPSWSRSSSASRRGRASSGSAPGWTRRSTSARSSTPARSTRSTRTSSIGRGEGELVLGGGRATGGDLANGHFFEPTIFAGGRRRWTGSARRRSSDRSSRSSRSTTTASAMLALNQTRYGLSSSVFTRDVNKAFRAMRDFETGIVYVNAGTTGAEVHLPFGGWKETGNGHREAGHVALDTYTEWKSIYVDFSGRLQRAQIDNQPG